MSERRFVNVCLALFAAATIGVVGLIGGLATRDDEQDRLKACVDEFY